MKKLMILTLLVLGATAYGAVTGNDNSAEMPLTVRGTVIPSSGQALVIEPIKNAGPNGTTMEFDFGEIVQGNSQALEGTYEIYRPNGSELASDDTSVEVGLLDNNGGIATNQIKTVTAGGVGEAGVRITFENTSRVDSVNNKVYGKLAVRAVAGSAANGDFLYTGEKVGILIN